MSTSAEPSRGEIISDIKFRHAFYRVTCYIVTPDRLLPWDSCSMTLSANQPEKLLDTGSNLGSSNTLSPAVDCDYIANKTQLYASGDVLRIIMTCYNMPTNETSASPQPLNMEDCKLEVDQIGIQKDGFPVAQRAFVDFALSPSSK